MTSETQTAKIFVKPEKEAEYCFELADVMTIGRSRDNQLTINEVNVSRRHAEIRTVGSGRYAVFDLGSANGTWLNGRRVTAPKELSNGDELSIGSMRMRYEASPLSKIESGAGASVATTGVDLKNETVVVMVTDIRNYTGMSESLSAQDFSRMINRWFRESGEIIENHGGTVDKLVGDAIKAYWIVRDRDMASKIVDDALATARETIELAERFSEDMERDFEGYTFRVGVGLNMGSAVLGDIGAGISPSLTVVGDTVNVAFRLEGVTKEKGQPVILSQTLVDHAQEETEFIDLGEVKLKGRKKSIMIYALKLDGADQPSPQSS